MAKQKMFFCNIGWMARYEGLKRKPDKIVGGGSYVDKIKFGAEVCNFVRCYDDYVYGHVETKSGKVDQKININNLGASSKDDFIDGITVIWTATDPDVGGRHIVGWYRNARVYRQRQERSRYLSRQHRLDKDVTSYIIRAKFDDAVVIPVEQRDVRLGTGKGWMGRQPWKILNASDNPQIRPFLGQVARLLSGSADDGAELAEINSNKQLNTTQKKALIDARIGQGQFRRSLISEWKSCAVLGCDIREVLRASHIKPWKVSNNKERLDRNNGLLLLASLDAAFDCGLISFSDSGKILVSSELTVKNRHLLGINEKVKLRKRPSKLRQAYLRYHREEKFRS